MDEAIHARAYRHGALPARVIVRLVDDRDGADLEMRALGCGEPRDLGEVARGPRRPRTFALAALAREPSRAKEIARELWGDDR